MPNDAPKHFLKEAVAERNARKQFKDSPSIRALELAHHWRRLLDQGKYRSLTEITTIEGIDLSPSSRTTRLTCLSPLIVESCLSVVRGDFQLEQLTRVCRVRT